MCNPTSIQSGLERGGFHGGNVINGTGPKQHTSDHVGISSATCWMLNWPANHSGEMSNMPEREKTGYRKAAGWMQANGTETCLLKQWLFTPTKMHPCPSVCLVDMCALTAGRETCSSTVTTTTYQGGRQSAVPLPLRPSAGRSKIAGVTECCAATT